jgi:phenylalanyl-tRNA synthetase beta subunit
MACSGPREYVPINRYPSLEQDFCLRSNTDDSYQKLTDFMLAELDKQTAVHGYGYSLVPLDIFQKSEDKKHKQTTWRIELWHAERTLTTDEANKLFDRIAEAADKELGAQRV